MNQTTTNPSSTPDSDESTVVLWHVRPKDSAMPWMVFENLAYLEDEMVDNDLQDTVWEVRRVEVPKSEFENLLKRPRDHPGW